MEVEYEIDRFEAQRAIEEATTTGTLELLKDKLMVPFPSHPSLSLLSLHL